MKIIFIINDEKILKNSYTSYLFKIIIKGLFLQYNYAKIL